MTKRTVSVPQCKNAMYALLQESGTDRYVIDSTTKPGVFNSWRICAGNSVFIREVSAEEFSAVVRTGEIELGGESTQPKPLLLSCALVPDDTLIVAPTMTLLGGASVSIMDKNVMLTRESVEKLIDYLGELRDFLRPQLCVGE